MLKYKKAGIVTNAKRDADFSKTAEIVKILRSIGIEPLIPSPGHALEAIRYDEAMFEGADFLITLGGDGTILAIADKAASYNLPVMGINIGNLGYLTDCSFDEAEASLKSLIDGDLLIQDRMMLEASVSSASGATMTDRCLNDVCVTRGATAKIICFDLYINDNFVDNYSADGLIVSTPTGSTAYNLSAGGPILIPNAEMFAITPICPHMLTTRPIVVSSVDRITVKVCAAKKETMITLDGRTPVVLNDGDEVSISKAESYIGIIKTNKLDFYDILRKKLIYAG